MASDRALLRDRRGAREAARRVHDPCSRRASGRSSRRSSARSSGACTGSRAWMRAWSSIGRPTRSRCCCSTSPASSLLYALQRLQHLSCRSIRKAWPRSRRTSPSTRRSASSPTRTGRTTAARARSATSCRWPASRCRTSSRRRRASRSRSRSCAASARRSASGIGNFWADLTRTTLYILLPICIVYTLFLVWQGVPQNLSAYALATTLEGAAADHRPRADRLAGGDQDARHQRRRLPQRQLGAPLREPDAAFEPRPDGLDLRDRRRADQRLRPHGRRRAPGLGDPLCHGGDLRCRRGGRLRGRGGGHAGAQPRSGWTAATWRARRSGSASRSRPCSR